MAIFLGYLEGGVPDKHQGNVTDFHGEVIGTYRITATWKTPKSYVSDVFHQVEATVGGVVYTGWSAGAGMALSGRPKKVSA